ncbi:MAG: ribosomal protein S18-alanine N-acetyltransferase [Clostridia bacterium]|nr:ribosomal protein S18-alanine N-acetyltransferase [Clostridia bacterium]
MIVTRLEPKHLWEVAALEQAVFTNPWSERSLELLCGDTALGFAAIDGDTVTAYGGMLTVLDEGQITNIATHPDHRRQGLAAKVLAALLEEARARGIVSVTLEVRASNEAAISLYQKFDFSVVGKRVRFYTQPTEDALIMQCTLTS